MLLRGFSVCFESCVYSTGQTASVQYGEGQKDQKNDENMTNSAIYWLWTHLRAYIKE